MTEDFTPQAALDKELQILKDLAQREYKIDYEQLIQDLNSTDDLGKLRFMRLLGVQLKKPFATFESVEPKNTKTGAYRGWTWVPEKIYDPGIKEHWQYHALEALTAEFFEMDEVDKVSDKKIKSFMDGAEGEGDIAEILLRAIKKNICPNSETKEKIKNAIDQAKTQGTKLTTPTDLIPTAGISVCGIVAASLPFGAFLGPLAGGITVLILYTGIDVLCGWIDRKEKKTHFGDIKHIDY